MKLTALWLLDNVYYQACVFTHSEAKNAMIDPIMPSSPDFPRVQMNTHYRWQSAQRYYVVELHTDLFGDLILSRYWGGRQNRLGGQSHAVLASLDCATAALAQIDQTRKQHGYQYID